MGRYLIVVATTAAIVALPHKMMAQTPALQTPGVRDYVSEVIRLNAAVQARRLNLGAATERIEPAGALPDPNVVAGVMSVPMPSFDFAAEAMTQLHLGLQQTFPFPGKRTAATELARADSDVSGADLNQMETDLSASAAAAYFELAYARTAAAVWGARLRVAGQAVAVAESRYGAGEVPQIDPLRARLELSWLEEHLDQIDASILGAGARADALRGGRGEALAVILLVDANGAPAFHPSDETLPDLEDSIGRLERQNSAMLAARTRVGRAQRAVRVFDLAGRPDFFHLTTDRCPVRRQGAVPHGSGRDPDSALVQSQAGASHESGPTGSRRGSAGVRRPVGSA